MTFEGAANAIVDETSLPDDPNSTPASKRSSAPSSQSSGRLPGRMGRRLVMEDNPWRWANSPNCRVMNRIDQGQRLPLQGSHVPARVLKVGIGLGFRRHGNIHAAMGSIPRAHQDHHAEHVASPLEGDSLGMLRVSATWTHRGKRRLPPPRTPERRTTTGDRTQASEKAARLPSLVGFMGLQLLQPRTKNAEVANLESPRPQHRGALRYQPTGRAPRAPFRCCREQVICPDL